MFHGEFGLNCGVAGEIPWVCVCRDSRYVVGDGASRECVESDDILMLGSLILSIFKRRESLFLLGLLRNVPFFNNLASTLSFRWSLVMSLKIVIFITSLLKNQLSNMIQSKRLLGRVLGLLDSSISSRHS